jgi:hypothetical protein
VTDTELTLAKLQERKEMHDFLFGISGGLKQFSVVLAATRNVLSLSIRSLADKMMRVSGILAQPADFALAQWRAFGMIIFNSFIFGRLQQYITARASLEVVANEIQAKIEEGIANKMNATDAILLGSVDYINGWRARFNRDHPQDEPLTDCTDTKDVEYPLCQYFVDTVTDLILALTLNHVSGFQYGRISDSPSLEKISLALSSSSNHETFAITELDDQDLDGDVGELVAIMDDIKFFLERANQTLADLTSLNRIYGVGFHVSFFLGLERALRPILDGVGNDIETTEMFRAIIGRLFGGDELLFLRDALFKVLMICKLLRDIPNPIIPDLDRIGNPIQGDVSRALVNLRMWFDFQPEYFSETQTPTQHPT